MGNLHKELKNCKHPNSRKTKQLSKKAKHENNKKKLRLGHAIKSNIIGEKLMWFNGKLENRRIPLTSEEFTELIEEYLKRFNDELEEIKYKQSISKNRYKQHIARENVIKFTIEKEIKEFNGGGLELLNLCDIKQCEALLSWDGNAINVQHFKLSLISRNFLKRLKDQEEKQQEQHHQEKNTAAGRPKETPKIIITSYCDDDNNPQTMIVE